LRIMSPSPEVIMVFSVSTVIDLGGGLS